MVFEDVFNEEGEKIGSFNTEKRELYIKNYDKYADKNIFLKRNGELKYFDHSVMEGEL